MSCMQILHYSIKYQDANIVVIRFPKKEISNFLKKSVIYIEMDECYVNFWKCFNESLLEISGVSYVIAEGYEITVVKDYRFPNWGKIIENVIWCSLLFLNPDGGAIEMSNNGRKVGKLITQRFNGIEPQYPRKEH